MLLKATSHDLSAGLPFRQEGRWQCSNICGEGVSESSQCVRHVVGLLSYLFCLLDNGSSPSGYFPRCFFSLHIRVAYFVSSRIGKFQFGIYLRALPSSVWNPKGISVRQCRWYHTDHFWKKDLGTLLVLSVLVGFVFKLHVLRAH